MSTLQYPGDIQCHLVIVKSFDIHRLLTCHMLLVKGKLKQAILCNVYYVHDVLKLLICI